jgi:hypothetical protein
MARNAQIRLFMPPKNSSVRSVFFKEQQFADQYIQPDYLHRPNADTPIEETMRALAELKA